MTVDPNSIDVPAFMAEHLQRADPDLLRSMLSSFVQALRDLLSLAAVPGDVAVAVVAVAQGA